MASARARWQRAPAKLNLYLDVLGRRDDGFHELETLFVPLPWGDALRVEVGASAAGPLSDVSLRVEGDVEVVADTSNLAVQAAHAFLERFGLATDVRIDLRKRIPVGAGLGGGSSDAAAVLRRLAQATGHGTPAELHDIAVGLGADVPFFLQDEAALGRGRGDVLEPFKAPPLPSVVLIVPPFPCATATVFANAHERGWPAPEGGLVEARDAVLAGDPARLRATHYNALAYAVLKAYPTMRRFTLDVERRLGRPPALTGSGSTLFDVPDEGESERVLAVLEGLPGRRIALPLGDGSA